MHLACRVRNRPCNIAQGLELGSTVEYILLQPLFPPSLFLGLPFFVIFVALLSFVSRPMLRYFSCLFSRLLNALEIIFTLRDVTPGLSSLCWVGCPPTTGWIVARRLRLICEVDCATHFVPPVFF